MSRRPRGLPFANEIHKFLKRFPELRYVGSVIKCLVCKMDLVGWNSSNCKRHIQSKRHIINRQLQVPHWAFLKDLIFMLSVCNIPPLVLNNEHYRVFWKKYVPKWPLPTREGLRRHVPHVKEQVENNIRLELRDRKLCITVDESMDTKKNKVGNVLVRILTPNQATKPYLIASKRLQKNNSEAIQQLVMQALEKFCIHKNDILMLVTGGDTSMVKAATSLKKSCVNLLHITCLLHAFHHVAENIRGSYQKVDKLIENTKMVFFESPQRVKEFHKWCPGIPEPPQPILTRWGTWLEAVFYYNKHFHAVKSVVFKFDPKESKAIKESQQQFADPQVKADLCTIQENYSILANAINQLQDSSASLIQSFEIVDNLNMALQNLTDATGVQAATKFNVLLNKNPDFAQLRHIKQCLNNGNFTSDLQQYYAYANITSLDVERSFLKYSEIFTEKRTCLKETTVEGILMMQAFGQIQPLLWMK